MILLGENLFRFGALVEKLFIVRVDGAPLIGRLGGGRGGRRCVYHPQRLVVDVDDRGPETTTTDDDVVVARRIFLGDQSGRFGSNEGGGRRNEGLPR